MKGPTLSQGEIITKMADLIKKSSSPEPFGQFHATNFGTKHPWLKKSQVLKGERPFISPKGEHIFSYSAF